MRLKPKFPGGGYSSSEWAELYRYQQELRDVYDSFAPTVGSIVMNCNPFTLGHRYLVEEALKQCDELIVFVVEEDKSFFPFADRIELVKQGLADLHNVKVLPSGKFIISAKTFNEYFNKESLQEQTIDASLDLKTFAKEIAPCLHIKYRFVGEEPFDKVTKQYNESMKAILTQYGIKVVEIPRKEVSGEAISASKVRDLLQKKEPALIKNLVPPTTMQYLQEKYL